MNQLESKVTIITGADGGLGTFVTEAFLAGGAVVIGVSRSIKAGAYTHPNFTAMNVELSSGEATDKLAKEVIGRFGRIDSLVHVMGGFAGGKSVADTDDATFEKMLDMNYRAAYYLARAIIPQMRKQGSGRFLAVASRQGAEPAAMVGAYSASKAALIALVRCIALENKDRGITANSVLPGTMDTPGNRASDPKADTSKWVQPSQVAALLAHLASDAAADITGAAIPIYGSQL